MKAGRGQSRRYSSGFAPLAALPLRAGLPAQFLARFLAQLPACLLACVLAGPLAGCADPDSAVGFNEPSPAARIRAIRQAARTDDGAAIAPLINLLESDDPAERYFAIETLREITGKTFGYEFTAGRAERQPAVREWAAWYASSGHNGSEGDGPQGQGS